MREGRCARLWAANPPTRDAGQPDVSTVRSCPTRIGRRAAISNTLPRAVTEAADISAITQLILRERSGRDLGLWQQMLDCYHPDSRVRLSWIDDTGPKFVRRSRDMAAVRFRCRLPPRRAQLRRARAVHQHRAGGA